MKNTMRKFKPSIFDSIAPPQYRTVFRDFFIKKCRHFLFIVGLMLGVISCNNKSDDRSPSIDNNISNSQQTISSDDQFWQMVLVLLIAALLVLIFYIQRKYKPFAKQQTAQATEPISTDPDTQIVKTNDKKAHQTIETDEQTAAAFSLKQEKDSPMEDNKNFETQEKDIEINRTEYALLELQQGYLQTPSLETPLIPEDKVTPSVEIAYLSLPMNEMIFNNASKSSIPMIGQSFYEFHIDTDGLTARFKFWNDPDAVKHAIDKPHSHIEPACEPLNARDSFATQIITVTDGHAVLEDNKWIVKKKAKIKYLV